MKPDGSEYYEIVLCYVDNVLAISDDPTKTVDGIKPVFKLKGDKAEIHDMYLGATIKNGRDRQWNDLLDNVIRDISKGKTE